MTTDTGYTEGTAPVSQPQADYFGFGGTEKFVFPDGVTFIEFNIMNEGQKSRFQRETNRDLTISRQGDARVKTDPAGDRHALISASCTDWNLIRSTPDGPRPLPFNPTNLRDFLTNTNPKLVEDLEVKIRKANPWMQGELSVKEIDEQIDELKKMREEAEEREAGESSSSSK